MAAGNGTPDIEDLARVAVTAGRAVMKIYAGPFDVEAKPDDSPVTRADIEAENVIAAGLAEIAPDIPIVAEEAAATGDIPDVGERFFLVDPLDGTREFVERNGEFTVNIALIVDGAPVMGVIHAPASGEIVFADSARGAFAGRVDLDEDDPVIRDIRPIQARSVTDAGAVALVSRSHCDAQTHEALARFAPGAVKPLGSSLKLCRIAQGAADLYLRHGPTMQWDTAAGDAILRAAGGCVVDLAGAPLRYARQVAGANRDFGNPDFCAFGDARLKTRL
jgi:3'(2'), 5'-bisphosphate nucleotidase